MGVECIWLVDFMIKFINQMYTGVITGQILYFHSIKQCAFSLTPEDAHLSWKQRFFQLCQLPIQGWLSTRFEVKHLHLIGKLAIVTQISKIQSTLQFQSKKINNIGPNFMYLVLGSS